MTLSLPPKYAAGCTADTVKHIYDQLTSVIAGHPQATTTYRFYEEIDNWLGPWGQNGYPIGYGKFYNIAFNNNRNLNANPITRRWVWRTTIFLQEALRDYVMSKIQDGSLSDLTESQLRRAAFDSHPRAYDQGGLAKVAMVAPELILVIATIPGAEFSPTSPNFIQTVEQVLLTLGLVVPEIMGSGLAVLPGRWRSGIFPGAVQQGRFGILNRAMPLQELGRVTSLIDQGKLDYLPWLVRIMMQRNPEKYSYPGMRQAVGDLHSAARTRIGRLLRNYRNMLLQSLKNRSRANRTIPNSFQLLTN